MKDVVSGFFLLFENQFAVGDFVQIRDISGIVEALTIRTTQIRVWTGELVILPNGSIDKVINYTRGNIVSVIDIYIAHNKDVLSSLAVMEENCSAYVKEHVEVVQYTVMPGIIDVTDMGIHLRTIMTVQPMSQWRVEREMKLKIYQSLEGQGIEVPYPKRVVIDTNK